MGNIVIVARVLPHSPITFKLIAIAYANLIEYASASILLSNKYCPAWRNELIIFNRSILEPADPFWLILHIS